MAFQHNFRRDIADICKNAKLYCDGISTKKLDVLRNGIDRNNHTYGTEDNRVSLPLGKTVTYSFETPTRLSNIHLQFDTDLNRETLPGDSIDRQRSMRANRTEYSVTACMPKTMVKGYRLTAITEDGNSVILVETEQNLFGCVNHTTDSLYYRSVSFTPLSVWDDDTTEIQIFSFNLR